LNPGFSFRCIVFPLHSASVSPTPACAPVARTRVTRLPCHVQAPHACLPCHVQAPAPSLPARSAAGLAARVTCVRRLAHCPRQTAGGRGGGRNHQNKFDQNAPRASKPRQNPPNHLEKLALSTQQTAGGGK
jgi:hypothetical protein